MAYANNETREVLLTLDCGNDNAIDIAKITSVTGKVKADIRSKFKNDDGDWVYTKKGVRVSAEQLLDIVLALATMLEADEKQDLAEKMVSGFNIASDEEADEFFNADSETEEESEE